jgi:diheme cytochrome c
MRASRTTKAARRAVAIALVAILASGCKRAQLPDADSPAAKLYVARCGNCHAPYNPHEMTSAMWETQVMMMEVKMQAAGQRPLTPDERDSILRYLKGHAGTE